MSSNSFGKLFKITTFGESHGKALGVIVDGCPSGIEITQDYIQQIVNERKSTHNKYTTQRKEEDLVSILSGIYLNKTLGTPIAMMFENKDVKSQDYDNLQKAFRPSHADITWFNKFNHVDYRGGGRASARETLSRVAGASIAYKILEKTDTKIFGFVSAIGNQSMNYKNLDYTLINNNPFHSADAEIIPVWSKTLDDLIEKGDSIGCVVEIHIKNPPKNLGEPIFDKINANLAKAIFSIPAVKGLEFGNGFDLATQQGSKSNDEIEFSKKDSKIIFKTNNSSGILGGITTGEDIILKIAIKPTSSIGIAQQTINKDLENIHINISGRHDPCIGIRAVSVCKAMCALTLVDLLLLNNKSQSYT